MVQPAVFYSPYDERRKFNPTDLLVPCFMIVSKETAGFSCAIFVLVSFLPEAFEFRFVSLQYTARGASAVYVVSGLFDLSPNSQNANLSLAKSASLKTFQNTP